MCIKSKWKCAAHGPPSPSSLQRVVLLVVPWSAEPHVLSVWIRWKKQLLSADQPSVSHQPRPPLLLLLHRPLYCNGTFTWFSHTLKPSWQHRWLCYSRLHMICQPVSHIQSYFKIIRAQEKKCSVLFYTSQYLLILLICNYTVRLSAISLSWCFLIDQQLKNLISSWLPTGTFPWQVHWHRLLSAFLQTHAEQEANTQRPWVHWPRVLQLTHMDQVIDLSCVSPTILYSFEKRAWLEN